MSLYKIQYQLESGDKKHTRYYKALSESTALDMFKETVIEGSLVGENPANVRAIKLKPKILTKENQV